MAIIQTLHRTAVPFVLLAAAACGSVSENDSPSADARPATVDASALECASGTYDIDVAWEASAPGNRVITGTVTLPDTLPDARNITLSAIVETPSGITGGDAPAMLARPTSTISYRVRTLPDDTTSLVVGLVADADGNGQANDPGDYVGWFDGTVAQPITDVGTAKNVTFSVPCRSGLDFGAGIQP